MEIFFAIIGVLLVGIVVLALLLRARMTQNAKSGRADWVAFGNPGNPDDGSGHAHHHHHHDGSHHHHHHHDAPPTDGGGGHH